MGAYSAGDLLGWDGNLVSYILQNFEANSAGTEQDELFDLVWNNNHSDFVAQLSSTCGMSLQDVLEKILAADGLSNELLNGLHSQNSTNFNNMFNSLLVGPPPPGPYPAGQISWLRSNVSDADLANAILSHYVNPMDIDAVLAMLSQILIEGAFSFGELIGFMECMNVPGLSNTLANNFSNQGLLHQLIVSNASQEYLLVLAMLNDPDFVKDVAENYSYLVAEAVRKLEGMSVEQYLALVKKHYGDGVMGDLLSALSGDLLFTKKFVLNEHHLYGSSRLGVKTHKRVLLRKEFSISGFEEDGTYIVDEVTDSLVYVASSEYFCRVLAQ
ncbi:MAG: hypothetical protein LC109_09535, partial [Bacteroidia bacterium]|nr:hypothetical protein [Bacteroidia bacterium]